MKYFSVIDSKDTKTKKFKKFQLKSRCVMHEKPGEAKPVKEKTPSYATRFQETVLGGLEQFFYKYGKFVAR